MITFGKFMKEFNTLRELGYPIGDNTQVIFDLDLRTNKDVIGFAFEDHGYRITIKKEIEHDDNEGRCD